MLDFTHLLYMLISGLLGAAVILALHIVKSERAYRIAISLCAVITVLLHYSPLWVDYLKTGQALAGREMLFLIYPCHICMWLLVLSAFFLEKKGGFACLLRDFTFWGGTVCGAIGTILNENYNKNPSLADYDVLKGLLSHSVLVLGCILLLTSGHVKIRVFRALAAVSVGLSFFVVNGLFVNWLFARFGLPSCNAMYLEHPPYPTMSWLNNATVGCAGLLLAFLVSALYEQLALPKAERWYQKRRSLSE